MILSKVGLRRPLFGNPFDLEPQLWDIWPDKSAQAAYSATAADWQTDEVLQIVAPMKSTLEGGRLGATTTESIVGLTGYFTIPESGHVFLRWTGVIPLMQRRGLFREFMPQLATYLMDLKFTSLRTLIELIPDHEKGRTQIAPAFEAVGFKRFDSLDPKLYADDVVNPSVPYAISLGALASHQSASK
jgi:hypothetical protein